MSQWLWGLTGSWHLSLSRLAAPETLGVVFVDQPLKCHNKSLLEWAILQYDQAEPQNPSAQICVINEIGSNVSKYQTLCGQPLLFLVHGFLM